MTFANQKFDLQKLFFFAVGLKLAFSVMSFYFNQPILMGVILPLLVMGIYIYLGFAHRDDAVNDEKFSDSCYYLGFIFTIFSIVMALFDINSIGGGLSDIAARFAAAMLSTVLGVTVRVILVSFRQTVEDSIQASEQLVVSANRRLADEMSRTFSMMQTFRGNVTSEAKMTVAAVKEQTDAITKTHKEEIKAFFNAMREENTAVLKKLYKDVYDSSGQLCKMIDEYSIRSEQTCNQIDEALRLLVSKVEQKVERVSFPDDIFTSQLQDPISNLRSRTEEAKESVKSISSDVKSAADSVAKSVGMVNAKTEQISGALEAVDGLMEGQKELMFVIKRQQQSVIDQLISYHEQMLGAMNDQQSKVLEEFGRSNTALFESSSVMEQIAKTLTQQSENAKLFQSSCRSTVDTTSEMVLKLTNSMSKLLESISLIEKTNGETSQTISANVAMASEQQQALLEAISAMSSSSQAQLEQSREQTTQLQQLGLKLVTTQSRANQDAGAQNSPAPLPEFQG